MKEKISRRKFLETSVVAGTGIALNLRSEGRPVMEDGSMVVRLSVRYYQVAQLYGPGMPPSGEEGLHERVFERPAAQIGLVLGHVWNLGEPDGPYPIGPDDRKPGEAADWVPVAHRIIRDKIKPALHAARTAGIQVFHLAQSSYVKKYPQYQTIAADPELNPEESTSFNRCVRPRSNEEIWHHEYGSNYPGPVWVTHPDKFDIAKDAKPLPNEAVFSDRIPA
jgi:hypothetical protein